MDESRESLLRRIQKLESEKLQLVQLLHETEETMAQQFKKSQEETAHLKQLFSSVLPLIKARASAVETGVSTLPVLSTHKAVQITPIDTPADNKLVLQIAALEQKLSEIELCVSDSKGGEEAGEELQRVKQRESTLKEHFANCKKLNEQLQSENDRFVGEVRSLQKENEMLRMYVLDSDGQTRPIPAVCLALYSTPKST